MSASNSGSGNGTGGAGRPHWSSRLMFIFAASGSAVGLGNIWKFPYIVGENGGGAFVLLYLACLAGLGAPLLIGEVLVGRRGGEYPARAFANVARSAGMSPAWGGLGALGAVIALLIIAFYIVVSGWVALYTLDYAGAVAGLSRVEVGAGAFTAMLADPVLQVAAVFGIGAITGAVVYYDVTRGVQSVMRIVAPLFVVLIVALLALVAATTGRLDEAFWYLFRPDFSALSFTAFGEALGHAFFTLSVGMCGMLIYGAYLDEGANVPRLGIGVALIDTVIALGAAMIIFPIVFAFELEAGAGPGLLFIALPEGFRLLPGGDWFGLGFFLATFLAAFSSLIALLIIVRHWLDETLRLGGPAATVLASLLMLGGGITVALSLNVWDGIRVAGMGLLDFLDETTSAWLLPLSGLGMAIFVSRAIVPALPEGPARSYLRFGLGLVAPLGILFLVASKL